MTINIKISAKVDNLTLSQIFDLLKNFTLDKVRDSKVYEINGYKFIIETQIDMNINYTITELID